MNLTNQQLRTMLTLQDKLNGIINPEWRAAKYPWHRAAWIEGAELVESLGWKWWKHQTPDMSNARLELVDMWHFSLSFVLQHCEGVIDRGIEQIEHERKRTLPVAEKLAPGRVDVRDLVESFIVMCTRDEIVSPNMLMLIGDHLELSGDELYRTYIAKNVLNLFRQDNGYKAGTYVKNWMGEEDNGYLMRLIEEQPGWEPERYLAKLGERYQEVLAVRDLAHHAAPAA